MQLKIFWQNDLNIVAIQEQNPNTHIEILAGDFRGNSESLNTILHAGR